MSDLPEPGSPYSGAVLIVSATALVVLLCIALVRPAGADARKPEPTVGPAEVAVRTVVGNVKDRIVVRDGPAQIDVWLFCEMSFDKMSEQIRGAISTRRALVGGFRISHWTWIEPDRTYLIDLVGPKQLRIRMTRHLKGTLLILPGIGSAKDAPRWTPPYRPLPLNMPHGPVR